MKQILFFAALTVAILIQSARAQDMSETEVQNLVNTRHYFFEAESARPQKGGVKHLTPGYFLQVAGDSLIAELPYYGRAYSAPINTTETGIKFTSTSIDYQVAERKKGGYEVSIKSKDRTFNSDFALTIYDDGTAYLQVSSPDRQNISFNGYLKEKMK